uniref:Uncharacterized protein n=1 Tax=Ascaris lumbricoides TaxID=6252 RepID=A0A0M3IPB4_ASCLU
MRLSDSNIYLCQNEHLQNSFDIPCFNESIEEWEKPRLISWTGPLITWMIKEPPEFIVCETNTSRTFSRHKNFVFLGTTVENIDRRSRGAELFEKYSNAPKYDDEPPPAEEIRVPKGDEWKKSEDLWDMQCPVWQKTATLILCIIEAFELLAFGVVLLAVQFVAKPKLRKYRIQEGIGITRKKRDMKKRAIRRLKSEFFFLPLK